MNNGYSSPTASVDASSLSPQSGTIGDVTGSDGTMLSEITRFDPDLLSSTGIAWADLDLSSTQFNIKDLVTITLSDSSGDPVAAQVRRLTSDQGAGVYRLVATAATPADAATALSTTAASATFVIDDNFVNAGTNIGAVVGANTWGLEGEAGIPEIDIKVDSIACLLYTSPSPRD